MQRVAITRARTAGVVAARSSRRKRRGTAGPSVRSRHCARVRPSVRAPVFLPVLRYVGFTHPHSAPRGDRTRLRVGWVSTCNGKRSTTNSHRDECYRGCDEKRRVVVIRVGCNIDIS